MDLENITLEDLLPHRDGMLLLGEIVCADETTAVSRSEVTERWPLAADGRVCPTVMIEVVAQTAGINNGIKRLRDRGREDGNMGWIAGVKSADFHVRAIPVGSVLVTRTRNGFSYGDFREVTGTVSIDGVVAGEITLQLVSA
jgi:predicted hotdog family 3-hydroxylacyl-ACP dehydratase